jgi:O-acetyl-ADP-ribose deacetylase (regulator of RNase III)/tRNA A-37 threonylcarbamoyl transferase component Bud32
METTVTISDPVPLDPGLTEQDREALAPRYEVLREVGRGGMGVVYKARQRALQRTVALKVTRQSLASDRFLREARVLAQIRSPHVVVVHDFDVLPTGAPVLVMEWVEGSDLLQRMRSAEGPLDEGETTAWMRQTCEGMQAAADLGIIHRDLKPSNILLDAGGLARVADFGLAYSRQHPDQNLSAGLTGTPAYMAPEQALDPRGVDTRADVYSFGATFYHALTGSLPFEADSIHALMAKHRTEPLTPPRTRNPKLSERVNDVLERCLAKAAADRFQSFAALRRQLDLSGADASPWESGDDAPLAAVLSRYQQRRPFYLERLAELQEPDEYVFEGGRTLRVLVGDLAAQAVDAVVSSEDSLLSMGGDGPIATGVASALRLAAGRRYVEQARRFAPVRLGRVVATYAGELPARFIFHGITLGADVSRWVCPSRDLILEILDGCFYHADTLNVQTMALPLLGTGAGGFSRAVCLDTTFRALARTLLRGLTPVREARIVLYRRPQL